MERVVVYDNDDNRYLVNQVTSANVDVDELLLDLNDEQWDL